jgi:hypothetical protein
MPGAAPWLSISSARSLATVIVIDRALGPHLAQAEVSPAAASRSRIAAPSALSPSFTMRRPLQV